VVARESTQQSEMSQRYNLADVDDLTQFADAAFSTEHVDLFEAGGGGESPLARLKAAVLSLDWEISESNLTDLSEEAQRLQEELADNALANIYLQGLDKLSRYVQGAQANTHQNAIKLLQIYYCDLERLYAAPDPLPDDILSMVREDVRRFRILSFQVGGQETMVAPSIMPQRMECPYVPELHHLKGLVLGIDWEVTDQVLEDLEQEVGRLRSEGVGGRLVGILLQGMDALARYMRQSGLRTHAAAFSVLYAMFDGVEQMLGRPDMTEAESIALILELGERFEGLKLAVARNQQQGEPPPVTVEAMDGGPLSAALPPASPKPGMVGGKMPAAAVALGGGVAATAALAGVAASQAPAALAAEASGLRLELDERGLDDYLGEEQHSAPALSGFAGPAPEDSTEGDIPTHDLDARLDAFFGSSTPAPAPAPAPAFAPSVPALQEASSEEAMAPGDFAPALAGATEPEQPIAAAGEEGPLSRELNGRLDDFFGTSTSEEPASAPPSLPAEEALHPGDLSPALFEAEEAAEPFAPTTSVEGPLATELNGRLDAFFGESTVDTSVGAGQPPAELPPALFEAEEPAEPFAPTTSVEGPLTTELDGRLDAFFGESTVDTSVGAGQSPAELPPALFEAEEPAEPFAPATPVEGALTTELDGRLDAFFGESTLDSSVGPGHPLGEQPPALFEAEELAESFAPGLRVEEEQSAPAGVQTEDFFTEVAAAPMSPALSPTDATADTAPVAGDLPPALFDAVEEKDSSSGIFTTEAKVETLDLDARLDAFFGRSGPDLAPPSPSEPALAAVPPATATSPLVEQQPAGDQGPALADVLSPEEEPAAALAEDSGPLAWELKEHLDAFFGEPVPVAEAESGIASEEEVLEELIPSDLPPALSDVAMPAAEPVASPGVEEAEALPSDLRNHLDAFFSEATTESAADSSSSSEIEELIPEGDLSPALSDLAVARGSASSEEAMPWELEGRLDAFFGEESAPAGGTPADNEALGDVEPLFLDDTVEEDTSVADDVELLDLEFESLGFEGESQESMSSFFVGETDTELIRLGDGISTMESPPSTELVRQWQMQTEHLLGQIPVYDERRMPLQLLDTVLAALPGSKELTASSTTLLNTLGRSLSQVMTVGAQPNEDSVLLAQYFNWQKEINRRMGETGQQPH